jgi:hypothetical protein
MLFVHCIVLFSGNGFEVTSSGRDKPVMLMRKRNTIIFTTWKLFENGLCCRKVVDLEKKPRFLSVSLRIRGGLASS